MNTTKHGWKAAAGLARFLFAAALVLCASALSAENPPFTFQLKSAPADLAVSLDGQALRPVAVNGTLRSFRVDKAGTLRFSAPGYKSVEVPAPDLPLKRRLAGVKLENENGLLEIITELSTGGQPKSAYFSADGRRLFIPLLNDRGIDVFRVNGAALSFEKRLAVPGSTAKGFVEALCDERRRELWVSNMEENKLHIFDLDTLEYKSSVASGGVMTKVIAQNPAGDLTVASNWHSQTISVFDSDSKKLLRRIGTGGTPRGMAFSPDGGTLYVAIYDEPVVEVIDMAKSKVVSRFRFYPGEGAARHVIYREGKLYVSDMYRGRVLTLDAASGKVLFNQRVGFNINTIVLTPDGRYVFASSRGRNHPEDYTVPGPDFGAVYMLDGRDLSLVERIWGRNQPTGLAVSPDGKLMVFTDFLDANLEVYRFK